jgi:hypothetical protein
MREEMLKKLDEYVDTYAVDENGEYPKAQEAWLVLRAELAAERCENCMYWGDDHRCLCATVQHQLGRLGCEMPFTSAVFCCMHFWAKKA